MTAASGIAGLFDLHVERIERIVIEKFWGGSVVFDQKAWPMISLTCRIRKVSSCLEPLLQSASRNWRSLPTASIGGPFAGFANFPADSRHRSRC